MATPGALADHNPDALIERIYNGEVPAHIATELGVHKCSIYRHLADHPEYVKAREIGMAVRLDDAEHDVTTADERTLPRAREAWRCVTWRAEREHPAKWGQRNQVTLDVGPDLSEFLRESRGRVQAVGVVAAQPLQCTTPHNDVVDAQVVDSDND